MSAISAACATAQPKDDDAAAPIVNATFALLHRLRDYEFQLYAADPSSSELIEQLAAMVGGMALRLGTLLAGVTVFMYAFGFFTFFTSILALAAPWGLLLTLFATGHQAIAAIIVQAKRRTLNAIQAKIAGLTAAGDLAEKDIMEAISRLMDYHDRVKATHNSALGIGVLLQFLQSLLLPLLASLLGSITDLRTLLFP